MLSDLHVRNLAVLEEVALELGPGLNVLTGETGAGKSIVVDALALLAGARASADLLRTGSDALSVTGRFEAPADPWPEPLAAAGLTAAEDGLVVRREVGRDGRGRAYLDDRPVTLRLLAEAAGPLLSLHAQREDLELASPGEQRALLDRAGGPEAPGLLAAAAAAHSKWSMLAERLARVEGDDRERRERLDWLRFQVREIDGAGLSAGEEETLRADREVLRHAEAVGGALSQAGEAVAAGERSVVERLGFARRVLAEVATWLPEAGDWAGELDESRIRLGELARVIRDRLATIEAEPGRLDAIESRLERLERLFAKHGVGSVDLLARRDAMANDVAQLEGDAEHRDELAAEVAAALADFRRAAEALSARRRAWAQELAARVHRELVGLGLSRARFTVELAVRRREDSPLRIAGTPVDFGAAGFDRVGFRLAANPGEEERPLARSASGGELARIYLALQLAVRADGPGAAATLVFDEADAGLGGEAAYALGRKLSRLARGGQILVVTHLPQVASYADRHFLVVKAVRRGRTRTTVERLEGDDRVREIARMLAGDAPSEVALSHAREMLRAAAAGASALVG